MIAILSVLVIVAVSLVVSRVATVALTLTGLSREAARFQSRSALTGAGFTTSESESVVRHPLRRRIIMALMIIGSAGIAGSVASLVAGFAGTATTTETAGRLGMLTGGLLVLLWLASSRWFDRALQPVIRRMLLRYTDLDARDYAALLRVHGDYAVSELAVNDGDWLADRDLAELRLSDEGVLVLGIHRDAETYLGAPRADAVIRPGDTVLVYGNATRIRDLDDRPSGPSGEQARARAIADQRVRELREGVVDDHATGDHEDGEYAADPHQQGPTDRDDPREGDAPRPPDDAAGPRDDALTG